MGDYQASSVGALTGGNASILVTWADTRGGLNQWGRIGTFSVGPSTPTPTATPFHTPTTTPPTLPPQPTGTAMPSPTTTTPPQPTTTNIVAGTFTPTATTTSTPCTITFTDVPPGHTFYPFVRCLLSGHHRRLPSWHFPPNNNVTRPIQDLSNSAVSMSLPHTTIFRRTYWQYIWSSGAHVPQDSC